MHVAYYEFSFLQADSSESDVLHPQRQQSVHDNEQMSYIMDSGGSYQVEVFGDIIVKTEFPVCLFAYFWLDRQNLILLSCAF